MQWIGLVSPDGNIEYNARFVLDNAKAEALEHGRWYTREELNVEGGEKHIKKWRCVKGIE